MGRHKTRGNGQGTAYQRGSRWYAEVCMYKDGSRLRAYKGGFQTKADAVAFLPELKESLLTPKRKKVSFPDLWKKWSGTREFRQLSEGKQRAYRIAYHKCASLHSLSDVRGCSGEMLRGVVQGLSFYPARDVKRILSGMFGLAMRMDCLEQNLASLLKLPPVPETKRAAFTDGQVEAIRKCGNEFRYIVLLMIETGMRPAEARLLRIEDVDFAKHLCRIGDADSKAAVVLNQSAEQILAGLCEQAGSGRICRLSKDDFYDAFYRCLEDAGVQSADTHSFTPYTCAHTFSARQMRADVSTT